MEVFFSDGTSLLYWSRDREAANENRTQPVLVVSYSAMIAAQAPEIWAPSTPTATRWGSRATSNSPDFGHVFNMTGANSQTNGASLEDCHANFFSLVSTHSFSSGCRLTASQKFESQMRGKCGKEVYGWILSLKRNERMFSFCNFRTRPHIL